MIVLQSVTLALLLLFGIKATEPDSKLHPYNRSYFSIYKG